MAETTLEHEKIKYNVVEKVDIAKVEEAVQQLNEKQYRVIAAIPIIKPYTGGFGGGSGSHTTAVLLIGEYSIQKLV